MSTDKKMNLAWDVEEIVPSLFRIRNIDYFTSIRVSYFVFPN